VVRALLIVTILLGCHRGPSGPTWPRTASPETDGGESLAPRAATLDEEDDESPEATALDLPAALAAPLAPAAKADAPTTTARPTAAPPADEPIMTEELVIEVED
jgi:hypothetical protein